MSDPTNYTNAARSQASGKYSASDQAQGQFAHNDNHHSIGHVGRVQADEKPQRGVEEVPYEDDRPQHFPEGNRQA